MLERTNNTLTANELRNDRDMMLSTGTPFVDGPTTQDALPVIERTSRSISRQKVTVIVSVAITIGVIILVVLIPALGLRKSE
ncbi:unnamed protein product [Adineta ricciae]|uniref:Uncharacterized protein n=1 Tax=Adineta ricciae TaxID=249248 RepID=A0A814KQ53_ADIRI|nr:unnamed protein product [Adineta ricciae]CAF0897112.1 unnamed protein product [Adineta ricciae]CAF1055058.1 unnamed protein product [Adineta ricciae]CAF1055130.1 unnamed protein product [Adineta ricciae]